MSKSSSPQGRDGGLSGSARRRKLRSTSRTAPHSRRLLLESLETRALLTYTYPFGATPDDTGEYMLGKIAVNVVLMESDSAVAPHDNGSIVQFDPSTGSPTTVQYTPEDWTPAAITEVENKVTAAMQWWKDTFTNMFPNAPANTLNFDMNFTHADVPVHTGYEPIARISDDLVNDSTMSGPGKGWLYDFLHSVGFDKTGIYSTDMRSFNDYTRQQDNADWAFTIFVVNNANDADKMFAAGGSYRQAFSFPGGQFEVVPASRPVMTFAHETGHQFWAMDEYAGGSSYLTKRGYYNTQNANSEEGQPASFVQAPTIMSTDHLNRNPQTFAQSTSFNNHVLDPYTMAGIGWQDSDQDGIMDVLDVPFTLTGSGSYDSVGGLYSFRGTTHVNALPNQNPSGTGDDITINQIKEIQYQINTGPWIQAISYPDPARIYSADISLDVRIAQGATIRFRSIDTRNGVTSNVVTGTTTTPTIDTQPGLEGTVYLDQNGNGKWDNGEPLQSGVAIAIADQNDTPIALQHAIEPDNYAQNWVLNHVDNTATLSAVGLNAGIGDVAARTYAGVPGAGKVFTATDYPDVPLPTWNEQQQLRVDFNTPVSTVSINAYGISSTTPSYARLDAYNSSGQVVARFTSGQLTTSSFTTMTVSRQAGDIQYVVAYGRSNTDVVLDSLSWGPPTSITSDNQSSFSFGYLPDGVYHLHVTPLSGYHTTNPVSGSAVITISGGVTTDNTNFGVASDVAPTYKFHNYSNAYNVNPNSDTQVTALDALLIINYINAHPNTGGAIPLASDPAQIGYIDVVADGFCAANDVLAIINYINAHPGGNAEADAPAPTSTSTATPATTATTSTTASQPQGEYTVASPQLPADYDAQQPAHSAFIRGADKPCNCAACRSARGEAVTQLVQSAEQRVPPAVNQSVNESVDLDTALELIALDVSQVKADGLN